MLKFQTLAIAALLAVTLIPGTSGALGIPDPLKDQNFTRYRLPSPASEMILRSLRGRPLSLSQLKGKVVLLNFWKIDCPPCALEKPILERIHRRFAGRGLEIVAVNLFDDYARMISYVRQGGFTFTFAYDRDNAFTVKQQPMRSGVSTSFVVNSHAEAIYEVRGVPTTYVINREGKVVGHAVGMANWEQGPMLEYLESLLGPPAPLVAAVERRSAYPPTIGSRAAATIVAQQTDGSASVQVNPSGRRPLREVTRTTPSATKSVQRKETRSRASESRSLSPRGESPSGTRRSASRATPQRNAAPSARTRSTASPLRVAQPVPRRHLADSGNLSQVARTGASGLDRSRTGRPIAASPSATSGRKNQMHTRMNPLPAASPYYRPGTRPGDRSQPSGKKLNAPVVYDEDGYVMARIPGSEQAPRVTARSNQPFRQTDGRTPSGYQQAGANPINGFILDSFERGPSVAARAPSAQQGRPNAQADASFLGRITSGISSTLSSINPLSR